MQPNGPAVCAVALCRGGVVFALVLRCRDIRLIEIFRDSKNHDTKSVGRAAIIDLSFIHIVIAARRQLHIPTCYAVVLLHYGVISFS